MHSKHMCHHKNEQILAQWFAKTKGEDTLLHRKYCNFVETGRFENAASCAVEFRKQLRLL